MRCVFAQRKLWQLTAHFVNLSEQLGRVDNGDLCYPSSSQRFTYDATAARDNIFRALGFGICAAQSLAINLRSLRSSDKSLMCFIFSEPFAEICEPLQLGLTKFSERSDSSLRNTQLERFATS